MLAWERARAQYSYPLACLASSGDQPSHQAFDTTTKLDRYHNTLLNSDKPHEVGLGYTSVVYWGHYAASAGRIHSERAMARAKLAIDGGGRDSHSTIRRAIELVAQNRPGAAAALLCELPQLGFAFATKVCAFAAPALCGVADSVIAERHPRFGFKTDRSGYLTKTVANAEVYDRYCEYLRAQAADLTSAGSEWRDRDGSRHQWRAVDVERALFGSAAIHPPPQD